MKVFTGIKEKKTTQKFFLWLEKIYFLVFEIGKSENHKSNLSQISIFDQVWRILEDIHHDTQLSPCHVDMWI